MQGFIESLIGEVDAMEKQMMIEDTNLFESYELDNVVVLEEDDDIDLEDLDEGYFSKQSKYKRLTKKANKANNRYLKASTNKNKADLKLNKFRMRHNI